MPTRKDDAGKAVKLEAPEKVSPRLLNIADAAQYMSCSVWFVRTMIWGRRIPFVKFGKRYLVDRSDLDKFIDSEKQRC